MEIRLLIHLTHMERLFQSLLALSPTVNVFKYTLDQVLSHMFVHFKVVTCTAGNRVHARCTSIQALVRTKETSGVIGGTRR